MNRFIQKNKFILILLTIVICLSCACGLTAKLDPTVNAAATAKTSANDYSWATMSEAAAQYLGQTSAPAGYHGANVSTPDASTAFAGNFLGYLTPNSESVYSVASLESANTVNYSYAALDKLNVSLYGSGGSSAWRDSAKIYAGFGYALTESGIDEPVIIGQTADDKRNIIGPAVLIIFLLCMALPKFFEMVLTFLSVANPFKLFIGSGSVLRSIVPTIDAGPGFNNQNTAVQTAMSNALTTLADTVTGLYNALYSLSFFAVVPILIALALFSWLVLRKSAGSVFKNLAIKVVFIGLGVPLMLACYTAAIDSVKDFMINTATGTPITVITSTFCNYGDWVLGDNPNDATCFMRLPSGIDFKVDQSQEAYKYLETSTSDRRVVQLINACTDVNLYASTALSRNTDANSIARDDANLVKSVRGTASSDRTTAVINLLQRYTKGEYITAGNLATKLNQKMFAGSASRESYIKLFNLSNSWKCFEPEQVVAYKYEKEDSDAFSVDVSDSDAKGFAENRLTSSGAGIYTFKNPFYSDFHSNFSVGSYSGTAGPATEDPGGRNYGNRSLSQMAAYNMLSSTFSDTAITVYSTTATSTNQVQLAHYVVSLAGQGYMELAYVFDACAIMCCLMVLGYGYGFALLFACFKGLIQIFPKVLTGMIGSMRGIAGSVALVAALIIEIIGTCIMYSLGTMFIGGIYELIEVPLATILTSVAGLPNQAAALVTVVASAIIIIKITGLLLKYRTAVVKSVSETATGFINKFMETNVVAPNLESNMSAGGLASIGLGMAMVGASTPAGSKLADRASELTDKVANADADKVASAAMNGTSLTGAHGEKYASAADAEKAKNEADMHEASSALSSSDTGGHYSNGNPSGSGMLADESESAVKTTDDVAADYVNDNGADFEKEIGYSSGNTDTDNSKLADKKKAGSDSDTEEDDFQGYTGRTKRGDGSVDEWENGRLVAKWDPDGNKIVDNSTQEITGTQTTDITSEDQCEADNKSAGSKSLKNVTDNSNESQTGSKFVMTDSDGHQQEVSIVNAKTGAVYTQADKDAGVNYDVVDSGGKSIYGNLEGGMNANTIAMSNGQPTVMVAPGSGGTNSFGGGAMYTLSQAPAPTVEAPTVSGSAGTQNVTQNVNQTNVTNTTANTSNMTTENTMQSMNTQQFANVSGSNAGSVQSAPSQGQTTIVHDNAGSSPVNVNVAGAGASGPAQVHVDFPGSGGGNAGGSAPVSSTVTEHVTNTVTNQTTESVIYSQGSQTGGSRSFPSGNQQNNTYVTSNTTVNQDVSNNVQNNVNN